MPAPTITPLPTPPSRSTDPINFAIEADAFVAALPEFATDANAQATYLDGLATAVDADAAAASADADTASAAADAALAAADVGLWVSGTTYAIGNNVISPASFQTYRRKTNGAGTTDPSLDATNWALITFYPTTPFQVIGNANAGSEVRLPEDTDNGSNYVALKAPNTLAANLTLTLPSADGTAGQLLSTDGAGQLAFASVTPSKYELISTASPSAASEVIFTGLTSAYSYYEIVFEITASNITRCQLSTDNGSTWLATGYYSNQTVFGTSTVTQTGASSQTYIDLGGTSYAGVIHFLYPTSTGQSGSVIQSVTAALTTSSYRANGRHISGGNNAIRLYSVGGSITGTFKLYGIKA